WRERHGRGYLGQCRLLPLRVSAISRDGEIVARVLSMQNMNVYAKAGIMIRESTAANAAHVMIDIKPNNEVEFETRPATGGAASWVAGAFPATPAWLRLTRVG